MGGHSTFLWSHQENYAENIPDTTSHKFGRLLEEAMATIYCGTLHIAKHFHQIC